MQIKYINEGEHVVNLDQAFVWVTLEDDLKITLVEAERRILDGSTKVITYAIWVASESEVPYKDWIKTFKGFEVIEDYPKATDAEVSTDN